MQLKRMRRVSVTFYLGIPSYGFKGYVISKGRGSKSAAVRRAERIKVTRKAVNQAYKEQCNQARQIEGRFNREEIKVTPASNFDPSNLKF